MTWNCRTVHDKVVELFAKHRPTPVAVEAKTRIVGDLGIDSLGVMEVIAELEDTFKLLIPDDALKTIDTVGDVIQAIVKQLEQDGRLSQ